MRSSSRNRGEEATPRPLDASGSQNDSGPPEDLAGGLRQLVSYAVAVLAALGFAWVWELDLALIRFLGQPDPLVTVRKTPSLSPISTRSVFLLLLGGLAWRT